MNGANHTHNCNHGQCEHHHHQHSCGCKACSTAQKPVFSKEENDNCSHQKDGEQDSDPHSACSHHNHQHGHEHSKEKSSLRWIIISLIFFAAGLISSFLSAPVYVAVPVYILSSLFAGHEIFLEGLKSIFKLKIDETTLLTIAVIAAFAIGEYPEASVVTILFAIGELLEEKAVARSRNSIAKLSNIRPDKAVIFESGKELTVNADQIKIGTEIIVKPHSRIPLDGFITEGATSLDSSAITGESIPISGEKGTEVLSGMLNGEGLIKVKTTKELSESTASRILKLVEDAENSKSSKEKFITRFAAVYTPIVLVVSLMIAVIPIIFGGDAATWIYRSLTCLVASCPCAIVISVPLAFFAGIGRATKEGVLIKGGKYVEVISKADCFAFDKTGTITTGKLTVSKVISHIPDITEEQILSLCAACEVNSSHPMAKAILKSAKDKNLSLPVLNSYREKPGYGVYAEKEGKTFVCGGKRILNKDHMPKDEGSKVFLLENGRLIGELIMSDEIRKESKSVIEQLKACGVKTAAMLTGDFYGSAKIVSENVGINYLKSDLLPQEKVEELNKLRKNHVCCYVGDGINDAPVMAVSDCSFAMGLGSEAAIETADAVLSAGTLSPLPNTVKLCKRVMNTAKGNIVFAIAVKVIVVALGILGFAPIWLAVLADTGVSILCIFNSIRLLNHK